MVYSKGSDHPCYPDIHVILSEAKNLHDGDVFLRDSSLRSEWHGQTYS